MTSARSSIRRKRRRGSERRAARGRRAPAALRRAAAAARRSYLGRPGVLAVGWGLKYTGGVEVEGVLCVQFLVRLKRRRVASPLPRHVFARRRDGSVDRSRRFPTDVIELRGVRFACESGSPLDVVGESGTATLIFRNRAEPARPFYLITCAHVAGDLRRSPPADPEIESRCDDGRRLAAETVVNSIARGERVQYDVALARITRPCESMVEHTVAGSAERLSSFLPAGDIHPGLQLDCAFGVSNLLTTKVASGRYTLPLLLDGDEYRVGNLHLMDRGPRPGDSGGLLYDGAEAAGILVAMSETGFGLFQPLEAAVRYLDRIHAGAIQCFDAEGRE